MLQIHISKEEPGDTPLIPLDDQASWDQLTYTAPEVENLKRSFPSGYAYETRACEVGAVQNAHFTVAHGVF